MSRVQIAYAHINNEHNLFFNVINTENLRRNLYNGINNILKFLAQLHRRARTYTNGKSERFIKGLENKRVQDGHLGFSGGIFSKH